VLLHLGAPNGVRVLSLYLLQVARRLAEKKREKKPLWWHSRLGQRDDFHGTPSQTHVFGFLTNCIAIIKQKSQRIAKASNQSVAAVACAFCSKSKKINAMNCHNHKEPWRGVGTYV
jgi:hypothetical protein